ncbi:hypothetical protein [Mycobacterium sp. GA-1841]|uniref:hypothetical protein n=1 Tax=Mycobacterium sp. GA-1841 TaxID=1834154 RepID=UPI0009FB3FA8|nr:hypothetical protein [Mycobacterium sp. GA-1841]
MTPTAPTAADNDSVAKLLAAMVRVLAGRPSIAEPGDLTITAVAIEAQLKRHQLTHKHTALKDLFYQLRDNQANPVVGDIAAAKEEVKELKQKLLDAREDTRNWKATAHTFARAIHVLTLENQQLKERSNVRSIIH